MWDVNEAIESRTFERSMNGILNIVHRSSKIKTKPTTTTTTTLTSIVKKNSKNIFNGSMNIPLLRSLSLIQRPAYGIWAISNKQSVSNDRIQAYLSPFIIK